MADTQTPEELEADIARQREDLARTVDQLGTKLDVKRQVKQKVDPKIAGAVGGVVVLLLAVRWWRNR